MILGALEAAGEESVTADGRGSQEEDRRAAAAISDPTREGRGQRAAVLGAANAKRAHTVTV